MLPGQCAGRTVIQGHRRGRIELCARYGARAIAHDDDGRGNDAEDPCEVTVIAVTQPPETVAVAAARGILPR